MRTRTVVLQAHTHQFLGTFGGAGNGDYRGELLRAIQVLLSYAKQVAIPPKNVVIRLDGLYGNAAPLSDVLTSGLGLIARSKDYQLLARLFIVQSSARFRRKDQGYREPGLCFVVLWVPALFPLFSRWRTRMERALMGCQRSAAAKRLQSAFPRRVPAHLPASFCS